MRSTLIRAGSFGLGVLVMVCSVAAPAMASVATVPEIDGGTITAGLAAASAAVMILRARRRSK